MIAALEIAKPRMRSSAGICQRSCLVTRRCLAKMDLLRFALSSEQVLTPDIDFCLPGRGYYLYPDQKILQNALEKNLFSRKIGIRVKILPDFCVLVEKLLIRRCLHFLNLARRSGALIWGIDAIMVRQNKKVSRPLAALISASQHQNSQTNSARKWQKLCLQISKNPAGAQIISLFAKDELNLAFGRKNVIYIGLVSGGLAQKFLGDAQRLARFRGKSVVYLPEDAQKIQC